MAKYLGKAQQLYTLAIGAIVSITGMAPASVYALDAAASADDSLQEVVVSAQKRGEERIQDVPIPITAVTAEDLVNSNQTRLIDYFSAIPNLTIAPALFSTNDLSIRGISTGGLVANPTVGILIDDVPYSAADQVPDLDPGSLARIEVLRGPQGTVYGASSMGGLIKYVTADPSTAELSGRVEAGLDNVYNGYSLGYNARASINVPINDELAVRASTSYRQDPGYLDNPLTHVEGLNESHSAGGTVSILWKPLDALSAKVTAIYQDTRGDGSSDITSSDYQGNAMSGDLQQGYVKGVGPYERKTQFYDAVLTGKLGIVTLTSVSGYGINTILDSFDATPPAGGGLSPYALQYFGVAGAPVFDYTYERKFTQELRASVAIGSNVEALVGVFYSHDFQPEVGQTILGSDPLTGAIAGVGYAQQNAPEGNSLTQERAVFTNWTFHATDRLSLQLGVREGKSEVEDYTSTFTGPYIDYEYGSPPPFVIDRHVSVSPSAFTYLVTPEFKLTPDWMVYARAASGFRPGGSNIGPPGIPPQYNPDKTDDYEIGTKGEFLDHTLSLDMSAYYIQWKQIQLTLATPNGAFYYTGNGGSAKSQGLELSATSKPVVGLTASAWVTISDAEITTFPLSAREAGTYAVPGDQLPESNRFSGHLSLRDEVPFSGNATGFAEADLGYVGHRYGVFLTAPYPTNPGPRQEYGGYAKADLQAGVHYEKWVGSVYVNNLLDRRALLSGGLGSPFPQSLYVIPPRTVGLTVSRSF
jgi:outer membrane receptor protein involved in Fe transport